MATFDSIIQETIVALSQVSGTAVQTYSEDRIASMVQRKFTMVMSELWWPDYMQWFQRTLDGVQGVTTVSVNTIKRFEDIRAVFRDGRNVPLPALPRDLNPFALTGSSPTYIERYTPAAVDGRVLQIWPKTATGDIVIHARVAPAEFVLDDEVFMDKDLLVYGAAYEYSEDDGANPGAITKFQVAFETRLNQLKKEYSNKPIMLDPRVGQTPEEWFEAR